MLSIHVGLAITDACLAPSELNVVVDASHVAREPQNGTYLPTG